MTTITIDNGTAKPEPKPPVTLRPPSLLWTVFNKLFGMKSRQYKYGWERPGKRNLPWHASAHRPIWGMQMGAVQCAEPGSTGRWVELLFLNGEAERLGVERDFHRYPNAAGGEVYESYRPTLHHSILSALCKRRRAKP